MAVDSEERGRGFRKLILSVRRSTGFCVRCHGDLEGSQKRYRRGSDREGKTTDRQRDEGEKASERESMREKASERAKGNEKQ